MAFNVRPGGNASSVPVDEDVVSGDVVVVGELSGIAQIDATPGFEGNPDNHYTTVALEGIASARFSGPYSFSAGDVVYAADGGEVADFGDKAVGIATRYSEGGKVWFKLVPNITVEVDTNGGGGGDG